MWMRYNLNGLDLGDLNGDGGLDVALQTTLMAW
jgi:hypothetical protein